MKQYIQPKIKAYPVETTSVIAESPKISTTGTFNPNIEIQAKSGDCSWGDFGKEEE